MENPWIGNYHAFTKLIEWLQRPVATQKHLTLASVCIVIGPSGVGKTHGIKEICSYLGKSLHILDSHSISNFKDCKDHICKLCSSNITSQFQQISRSQQVICIEELETLMSLDRTFVHSLQKLVEASTLPHVPILITCHSHEKKRIQETFGNATIIELCMPTEADILILLRQCAPDTNANVLLSIAEKCNGNISTALNMLEVEELGHGEDYKAIEHGKIDQIPSLLEVYRDATPARAAQIFFEDPWLHPLRFHENLPHELKQRKGVVAKKHMAYMHILYGMCYWDYFMSSQKGDDLSLAIEFIALHVLYLRSFDRKKNAEESQDHFTKMFSHLSLEKKNLMSSYHDQWENIGSYHKSLYENSIKRKKFSS